MSDRMLDKCHVLQEELLDIIPDRTSGNSWRSIKILKVICSFVKRLIFDPSKCLRRLSCGFVVLFTGKRFTMAFLYLTSR